MRNKYSTPLITAQILQSTAVMAPRWKASQYSHPLFTLTQRISTLLVQSSLATWIRLIQIIVSAMISDR